MNNSISISILVSLKRLYKVISKRRRLQIYFVLVINLLSSLSEIFSLAAVFPFLGLILNTDKIIENKLIRNIATFFGINSSDQLILPVTSFFICAVLFSACMRLFNVWLNKRIAAAISSDLSSSAFESILFQPYSFHIDENSSSIISLVTNQIDRTTTVLNLVLVFITSLFISTGLLIALLYIDFKICISLAIIFSFIYLVQALSVKKRLSNIGEYITIANKKHIQIIQESLGAIRDILLDNNQRVFLNTFSRLDIRKRNLLAESQFITAFPRYVTEALGITLLVILIYVLFRNNVEGNIIITTIGTIGLGLQRLLPQIFSLYTSWAGIKSQGNSIEEVLNMIENKVENYKLRLSPSKKFSTPPLINISGISFRYKSNSPKILDNVNLQIKAGDRLGIIGETGCGKSTLIDILMGLLKPSSGSLLLNNLDLYDENNYFLLAKWRSYISHVPQDVFLSDSPISENIAFGIDNPSKIDMKLVKDAARKAKISNFIESLPNGYNTFVGERGINLSGGQKQRIAIARALYKKKKFLIFDESTSALDQITEKEVMKSILSLEKDITLIIISHKVSALSICDRIITIKDGLLLNVES